MLGLPLEQQRRVLDFLGPGDHAAIACTCRELRRATQLESLSESQRIAAALRHEHLPWLMLAREHLSPRDLYHLLAVAEEFNRTRQGADRPRITPRSPPSAPGQWTFYREQRHHPVEIEIGAMPPRGAMRPSTRLAVVHSRWDIRSYRAFMPSLDPLIWPYISLPEEWSVHEGYWELSLDYTRYSILGNHGGTMQQLAPVPDVEEPPVARKIHERNRWVNLRLMTMKGATDAEVRALLDTWCPEP